MVEAVSLALLNSFPRLRPRLRATPAHVCASLRSSLLLESVSLCVSFFFPGENKGTYCDLL